MFGAALITSGRSGVVAHRIYRVYATAPPTFLVVQQEGQEGSCAVEQSALFNIYLSIYRDR